MISLDYCGLSRRRRQHHDFSLLHVVLTTEPFCCTKDQRMVCHIHLDLWEPKVSEILQGDQEFERCVDGNVRPFAFTDSETIYCSGRNVRQVQCTIFKHEPMKISSSTTFGRNDKGDIAVDYLDSTATRPSRDLMPF